MFAAATVALCQWCSVEALSIRAAGRLLGAALNAPHACGEDNDVAACVASVGGPYIRVASAPAGADAATSSCFVQISDGNQLLATYAGVVLSVREGPGGAAVPLKSPCLIALHVAVRDIRSCGIHGLVLRAAH